MKYNAKKPRHKKYVKARAQGMTQRKAAVVAGFTDRKATGSELEKDPECQKAIAIEVVEVIKQSGMTTLLAKQTLGELPTKIVDGGVQGRIVYRDMLKAAHILCNILGFLKHTVDLRVTPVDLSRLSDKELDQLERIAAKTEGPAPSTEEAARS